MGCKKHEATPKPPVDAGPELPIFRASIRISDGDKPAPGQPVVFQNADGTVLATVKTDTDGKATGPIPAPFGMATFVVPANDKRLLTLTHVSPDAQIEIAARRKQRLSPEPLPIKVAAVRNPKSGTFVISHPPPIFPFVEATLHADGNSPSDLVFKMQPLNANADTPLRYTLPEAPYVVAFRLELSSDKVPDHAIVALRSDIMLKEMPLDMAGELPGAVSKVVVDEAPTRPTLGWNLSGKGFDIALYQLNWAAHSWTALAAADGATSFQMPALPDELADFRPGASPIQPGVALIEASDVAGYEATHADVLYDFTDLPRGRTSYRIWVSGTVTPVLESVKAAP